MVDVRCGIGGSSRHIAKKFGCKAEGITLSPVQVLTILHISPVKSYTQLAICADYWYGQDLGNMLHCGYTL